MKSLQELYSRERAQEKEIMYLKEQIALASIRVWHVLLNDNNNYFPFFFMRLILLVVIAGITAVE